jgi:acetyl-CoA C-acetyltransferase
VTDPSAKGASRTADWTDRRAPEEPAMPEAYIVDAVRTPVGRRGGGLSRVHPADLGAVTIKALVERTGIDPMAVDDVVWGCVDAIGPQAGDIARTCWLVAGYPEAIPGTTVDRQCGSSQQAVHFGAQGVMSGTQDLVVVGGVQNMSQIPISSAMTAAVPLGFTDPFSGSKGWVERYGTQEVSQFRAAELIAEKWDISRDDMEAFAYESHQRGGRAQDEGRFEREIVPVDTVDGEGNPVTVTRDEGVRRDTTREKMASLKTLVEGGRLTAAVSSQISDASSAMLIASEQAVRDHGLTPRARIHHLSVRGDDPIYMLTAPIPATRYALERSGMTLDQIDLVEINEAFASVVIAWFKEIGFPHEKTNVNGGAISLGHPLGATGTRLMTTMLHELERTGGRYGLQTMCEGGGQANVTIIERL